MDFINCINTPLFLVERNLLNLSFLFPALVLGRLINGLVGLQQDQHHLHMLLILLKEKRTLNLQD